MDIDYLETTKRNEIAWNVSHKITKINLQAMQNRDEENKKRNVAHANKIYKKQYLVVGKFDERLRSTGEFELVRREDDYGRSGVGGDEKRPGPSREYLLLIL